MPVTTDNVSQRRFGVLGRQLPFTLVTSALLVILVAWQTSGDTLPPAAFVALALVFVATVAAAVTPWQMLPRWTEALVPLLDMVAVVVVLSMGVRAAVLVILPVVWLAQMGRAGAVVAVVTGVPAAASVDIATAVRLGELSLTPDNAGRLFIVPAAIVAVAVSLHLSERRSAARRELLAGQSALVEELLEETALERTRLEGVLNTIDAGVAVLDNSGTIVVANRALREASAGGFPVGEHLTLVAPRLLAEDGVTPVTTERLTAVANGAMVDRRVVWWAPDAGASTAFRISAAPLPRRDGVSEGTVLALHDITAELHALSQRDDFVSSVSHELRTPLTSVTGYLDLAVDDPDLPVHVRGYLEVAERNAGRLRLLIDNLLTAARTAADAGTREAVDLRSVVEDVVESQTPRAADRSISIDVTQEGTGVVRADEGRLTQVVDNIVSNAVKYTHPGGHVRIALSGPGDGAGKVRLIVSDDGPGIATEAQSQVFTRFYRAPEVRHTAVQGTGLGLHISRQIVEALGGSITLRSTPGRGTSVEVRLPAGGDR